MTREVYFRVDANHTIGYGHLTRCIAICNSSKHFSCTFFSTDDLSTHLKKEAGADVKFHHLKHSEDFYNHLNDTLFVILDGYQFSTTDHAKIRQSGAILVVIDDYPEKEIYADISINSTPANSNTAEKNPLEMLSLRGLDYVMLRPPFLQTALSQQIQKKQNTLFICFGGSDPLNKTREVVDVIMDESIDFQHITIVTGADYLHLEELKKCVKSAKNITILSSIDAQEMARIMLSTEYAIVPASGMLLEALAARMKIISGYYVENQRFNYENHLSIGSFSDAGMFSPTGIRSALKDVRKRSLPDRFIDGKSIERIEKNMLLLAKSRQLTIREAQLSDTHTTYEWANSPSTRQYSFNQETIPFSDHESWFRKKVVSPNCHYLILENDADQLGSIRFDISDQIATISYLVSPEHYKQGYGTTLMILGLKSLSKKFSTEEIKEVRGFVLPKNIASLKTFERFGFQKDQEGETLLFKKKFIPHENR